MSSLPPELPAAAAVPAGSGADAVLERLGSLREGCGACQRCDLAATRGQVVVGRGAPQARLMLIGEGPGADEDACGLPFVGRAGRLLEELLAEAGLDSERDAYITNVVKCRPPGNRKPTAAEMDACFPWLRQQITLVDPTLILLVGATALQAVLGVKGGITRLRGEWRAGEGPLLAGRWLMPVFHPSYLLRNPSRQEGSPRALTGRDLQEARQRLERLPQPAGAAADSSIPAGL
jgi:DNA polymerase